jgi:hypothetical protein
LAWPMLAKGRSSIMGFLQGAAVMGGGSGCWGQSSVSTWKRNGMNGKAWVPFLYL